MSSARPASLGSPRTVRLGTCSLRWFESGPADGPVVVFVHGLLVNADLWRRVAPGLAGRGLRCIVVDWPLGSHETPVPDADLTPPGVADLIAELLDVLALDDVTIVANDTGGALTQILMTRHPERIGRVVLTSSDSFERFFPPLFAPYPTLARVPGAMRLTAWALRLRWLQRSPLGFGWLAKHRLPDAIVDGYLRPSLTDPRIRRDTARFLRSVHRRHTMEAAARLGSFDRPVLLAWAEEDRHFPISLAHRLAAELPRATVVPIADSYTFVPEDQPDRLVDLVHDFVTRAA